MLRLFGIKPKGEPLVTEEEVRALVEQGQQSGVFFPAEKELVERALELDELKRLLEVKELPGETKEEFQTLSGFAIKQLQHIPREGEHFLALGHRFEIADMDQHRVDKVLIQRWPVTEAKSTQGKDPAAHD